MVSELLLLDKSYTGTLQFRKDVPMPTITNPLTLSSHTNPYPHYQALRDLTALRYDPERQFWIASSAKVVQAILSSEVFVVRPPAEKIPSNIRSGNAAEVFGHLVRMNEGMSHQIPKQVLQTSLRSINFSQHQSAAKDLFQGLAGNLPLQSSAHINAWQMAFPVSLVAHLCGFSDDNLAQVVDWTRDFVACLSPLSTNEQIQNAHAAARELQTGFLELLRSSTASPLSFLASLQAEAGSKSWHNSDAIIANLIGLLSQTYEATAGLIGNSIVTLHTQPLLRAQLVTQPERITDFIAEVACYDPPVQNTRRFVTQDIEIAGQHLRAGEAVLLLLAAANRDPQANRNPETFELQRDDRCSFTFSHARHQCPGQALALSMTALVLSHVISHSTAEQWQALKWQYRPSLNGRIPLFREASTPEGK